MSTPTGAVMEDNCELRERLVFAMLTRGTPADVIAHDVPVLVACIVGEHAAGPANAGRPKRGDMGKAVLALWHEGIKRSEIARRLDATPMAISQAIIREKHRLGLPVSTKHGAHLRKANGRGVPA